MHCTSRLKDGDAPLMGPTNSPRLVLGGATVCWDRAADATRTVHRTNATFVAGLMLNSEEVNQ